MKKRGYFIHGGDPEGGFAVVATSLKEAKRIVFKTGQLEVDWIDMRGHWCRGAKVDDKPIGMINDLHTGLVRGMYGYLEDFKCDRCGKLASIVHSYKGLALCISCEEEAK
jgi:hypothetical protein